MLQDSKALHRESLKDRLQVPNWPAEKFNVIYADPPWRFATWSPKGMDRAAENHYPSMTLEDVCALPVRELARRDAVLFLWATSPLLPAALGVMAAWDFTYKSHCIWVKDKIGLGFWFRNQHELLLVGTRGRIGAPPRGSQFPSIAMQPRGRHSEKPSLFRDMIDTYYPRMPKIELFARGIPPVRWTFWGPEAEFDHDKDPDT